MNGYMTMTNRRFAGFAVLAAAAVVLAGCGGGSKSRAVASVATTTTSAGAPSRTNATGSAVKPGSTGSGADSASPALAFARCMRAHGVPNFPDPNPGGGFTFHAGAGFNPVSPAVKAAQAKCQQFMGGGPPGPGATTHPSAAWLAHMVKVARCMRRHGVTDFPDPRTSVPANPFPGGTGGVISDIEGVILVFPDTIDTHSPLFTRAAAACDFPLHNR
jgi:hypothetical protein